VLLPALCQGNRIREVELVSDTEAYCWGENQHGELGDGTTTDRLTPTAITAF
jgi:alpha-tubulin suppressor-like RCC1 family protein